MPFSNIDKPSKYFDTKLYTGNGSTQSIGGLSFKPDFVWIKNRTNANSHQVFDNVRGVQKALYTNGTDAEETNANFLTAFNSDGISVGSGANVNGNASNVVAWNFLGANTTVSNTSGTITSTVSANTTSGFSIVSYTGTGANATVGHGLGVVPKMYMVKCRSTTGDWRVYTATTGNTGVLFLNDVSASVTQANMWNSTTPTSSVFSLGTNANGNSSGATYIAYCFAEVKGYSKFGSYTGNGSTDGTFVYTGFKPKFFLVKRTDTTNSWTITNSSNQSYNQADTFLLADSSQAESTATSVDYLSNGVKIRSTGAWGNASGGTYIYMAFAEQPLVGTNNVPATAR